MRVFLCLLLSLCGVLSSLQINKDLQYNCYYQILKQYSTKSSYYDDDYIDYNHRSDDSLQLSIKDTESTETFLRVPRNSITGTVESDKSLYHNRNHLTGVFSSAYAEPRNSGHFRPGRDHLAPSRTFTTQNVTESNYLANNFTLPEISYFIVASKILHPGFVYKVSVSVLQSQHPIKVFANISCDSVNLSSDTQDIPQGVTETLLLRIPPTALRKQTCHLRMEGFFLNVFCDLAFLHEHALEYVQHSHMILIQTDKPFYMQGDTVRFRVTVTNAEFKPSDCIVELLIIDPNQHIVRRWLTQLPPAGTVALDHRLAQEPSFGEWTINVGIAELGGQQEKLLFSVEEYYSPRVEVEVIMPAAFFSTTAFIKGSVKAGSTFGSGEVIGGNLTLVATIYPLGYLNAKALNRYFRLRFFEVSPELCKNPKGLLNCTACSTNEPNAYDYYNEILVNGINLSQKFVSNFNGNYIFKWPRDELEKFQGNFTALEILVIATVTVDSENEVYSGYAIARIYKPTIHLVFLGGSPQVFKPSLPFTVLIAAEHLDGSPIDSSLLKQPGHVEVSGTIQTQVEAIELSWPKRSLHKLRHHSGIWELKIDLQTDLLKLSREILTEITEMKLKVNFATANQEYANPQVATTSAELLLIAHYSPRHQHIKVTTSTELPIVGEYMIFEISTNFYVELFHYMILSKGVIVFNERESLTEGMRTIALVVSAEMAPVSEIVVWVVTWQGQIVTDSLIFPVTGMFTNNFTVSVQNSHKSTDMGNKLYEVSISAQSGSYVSLSGIAQDVDNMQPDSSMLSYSTVILKMSSLDKNINKMHKHVWNSHQNLIGGSDAAFYETSTFGIDASGTFLESGLIVLTDGVVPRRSELFNQSFGSDQCLTGSCILFAKKCGNSLISFNECDQIFSNQELLSEFSRFRINRIFRHYDNVVWFWKDVQIGSRGPFKFYTSLPSANVDQWIINSHSTSPTKGVGFIRDALVLDDLRKQSFDVAVALPSHCRRYEHVGILVSVLNKKSNPLGATISLQSSPDYSQIANKSEKLPISLTLDAREQKSVAVYLRPTTLGSITVVLKVRAASGFVDIKRELIVESADVRYGRDQLHRLRHHFILLNLTNQQNNLVEYLKTTKPSSALKWTRISVVGNAFATSFVSPTMDRFLDATRETVQEFVFAQHLYSLMYLRLTKKHNASSEREIYYKMNLSYQHLLGFLGRDGSFSHFRNVDGSYSEPSVWLTAYCLRLFQEASSYKMIDYIWIDMAIIEKGLNWLLQQQTSKGFWLLTDASDLHENNVTLTAHVLITLAIMRDFNDSFAMRIKQAKANAASWIERNLHRLQNANESYDLAVTTYALLLHKSPLAERTLSLLQLLARRRADYFMYWNSFKLKKSKSMFDRYDSISTEATAYALLCYLMHRDSDVNLIVNWLNIHRLQDEGWRMSTRALNAAMRALIEFTARSRRRDSAIITVKLTSLKAGQRINHTLHINSSNSVQIHSIELFDVWGPLKISANGVGYAILQVDHEEEHVDVDNDAQQLYAPAFRIHNKAICRDKDCSHISYTCCINWLNMEQTGRSGMSILDVAIPTGYKIQQQQLHSYVLSKSVKHLIQAKFMETRILFYFRNLVEEDVCVAFTVRRWYTVANLTIFLPIHVYEYNAPEHFAEITQNALSPQRLLNVCAVCGSSSCVNCPFNTSARKATTCVLHALLLIICCLLNLQAKKVLP